jgi:hypothetical protein
MFQTSLLKIASALALSAMVFSIGACASRGIVPTTPSFALAPTASSHDRAAACPVVIPAWKLRGEILTATNVVVRPGSGRLWHSTFIASGTAQGPHPGTFHATGEWGLGGTVIPYHVLSEQITIRSRGGKLYATLTGGDASNITETFTSFGPATHLFWSSGKSRGLGSVKLITSGSLFEQLGV